MNKKATAQTPLTVFNRHRATHHSIHKLFVIGGYFTLFDGDQIGFQLHWIDQRIAGVTLQWQAVDDFFPTLFRQRTQVEFAAGGAPRWGMAADAEVKLQWPVRLNSVVIHHVASIGDGYTTGFANFFGQLFQYRAAHRTELLVVQNAPGDTVHPLAGNDHAAQIGLHKPIVLQLVEQPMNARFGDFQKAC